MVRRLSLSMLVCAIALSSAAPRAAETRFITERDLLKFTWVADPQISPDGSTVAFVRVTVNEKENRYESTLFVVPASGAEAPRRRTGNTRDTSPRWAPDGKRLAFIRAVEKDGKPQPTQIYLLAMDGGEARPITELPNGAGAPEWSPDGKTLAFTAPVDDKKAQERPEGQERRDGQERGDGQDGVYKSDVKVITKAVYRANGNPGYVGTERHAHIFTI